MLFWRSIFSSAVMLDFSDEFLVIYQWLAGKNAVTE
jgi:hypothetical protein